MAVGLNPHWKCQLPNLEAPRLQRRQSCCLKAVLRLAPAPEVISTAKSAPSNLAYNLCNIRTHSVGSAHWLRSFVAWKEICKRCWAVLVTEALQSVLMRASANTRRH